MRTALLPRRAVAAALLSRVTELAPFLIEVNPPREMKENRRPVIVHEAGERTED